MVNKVEDNIYNKYNGEEKKELSSQVLSTINTTFSIASVNDIQETDSQNSLKLENSKPYNSIIPDTSITVKINEVTNPILLPLDSPKRSRTQKSRPKKVRQKINENTYQPLAEVKKKIPEN